MDLKLQGRFITFEKDDVILGDNRFALLADVERPVMVKPGEFAQVAAPITFSGDGATVALIDLHAGRLAHALDDHSMSVAAQGQYFLPPIGEETTVFVDVINETNATMMIHPGLQIGVMTFIGTASSEQPDIHEAQRDLSSHLPVRASFAPKYIDASLTPEPGHALNPGLSLRADMPDDYLLKAGLSRAFCTGFIPEIPEGFEAQIRVGDVGDGITVTLSKMYPNRPVAVFLQNVTSEDALIRPADIIGRFLIAPVQPAAYQIHPASADTADTAAAR